MTFLSLIIQKAYAQQTIGVPIPGTSCSDGVIDNGLSEYIGCLYEFATYLAVGFAIIMVIWGGYKYITSQGNPDTVMEAKEIIGGAIIGLVVLGLAYLILSSVGGGIV